MVRWSSTPTSPPITVALVNDYDVVLQGLARMLDRYRDRVVIVEIDANEGVEEVADIVLYDNFAQPESDRDEVGRWSPTPSAPGRRLHLELPPRADRERPPAGSPRLPVQDAVRPGLVDRAGSRARRRRRDQRRAAAGARGGRADWPGRTEGLTDRESEILALITQGMSNAEVGGADASSARTP